MLFVGYSYVIKSWNQLEISRIFGEVSDLFLLDVDSEQTCVIYLRLLT